jgi:hypothetical protein
MTDRDLDRVNASGAVDFAVESAGPDRLVVVGFVDQPRNLRARTVFEQILYVQMPWRISFRVIEQRSLTSLLVDEPGRRRWEGTVQFEGQVHALDCHRPSGSTRKLRGSPPCRCAGSAAHPGQL